MANNENGTKVMSKHITGQLLAILLPMVISAIAFVTIFLAFNARNIIIDSAKNGLQQEAKKNASDISGMMEGIVSYYNAYADTLQVSDYADYAAILKSLEPGMKAYPGVVSDVYLAFGKDYFYDGGGWVPDEGYDPTTRAWYQNGQGKSSIVLGDPSVDLTTGQMVVCGSRGVTLTDGRSGVLSTDIVLSGISETASAYKPLGTGSTMMFDGTIMVASPATDTGCYG